MRLARVLMIIAVVSVFGALPAHATVMAGQIVELTYEFPSLGTVFNGNTFDFGVPSTISGIPLGDPRTNIAFGDTQIDVTFNSTDTWTDSSFNGFHVFDLFGTIPAFSSVVINPATNMAGLDASRITFDADNIWVNWHGLAFNNETFVSLEVNAEAAVPEPSTLILLGMGIPGLVRAARRRQ